MQAIVTVGCHSEETWRRAEPASDVRQSNLETLDQRGSIKIVRTLRF